MRMFSNAAAGPDKHRLIERFVAVFAPDAYDLGTQPWEHAFQIAVQSAPEAEIALGCIDALELEDPDPDKAGDFLEHAYQTGFKFKDSILIAITTSHKGHLLLKQGKFKDAVNILNYSKSLSRKIGDRTGMLYCHLYIGLCFFENKQFKAASIQFDSVLTGPYSSGAW